MEEHDKRLWEHARSTEPPEVDTSAVVILRRFELSTEVLGSGTLFAIADRRFVVTAKHVVSQAMEMESGLLVANQHTHTISLGGRWISSEDKALDDIAVFPLGDTELISLGEVDFARAGHYERRTEDVPGLFVQLGFPRIRSNSTSLPTELMNLTLQRIRGVAYNRATEGLNNFDRQRHFLIDASEAHMRDDSHNPTSMRTLSGYRVPAVDGIPGMSGGGIWRLGNPNLPLMSWRPDHARLVGVQTSVYKDAAAIKVTKWSRVMELLAGAFPDLRNALVLHGH
jgi:hypothetical protein